MTKGTSFLWLQQLGVKRFARCLAGFCLMLFALNMQAGEVVAVTPALLPTPSMPTPSVLAQSVPIVASYNCLGSEPTDIAAALSMCNKLGVETISLAVERSEGSAMVVPLAGEQSVGKASAPLSQVLSVTPAPKLLLQVMPDMLDQVLLAVYEAKADGRVALEPVIKRPQGSASSITIASGLRYWRMQRNAPRAMMIHVLEVDLTTPGLELLATPGTRMDDMEFVAEKTSDYARRSGLVAAVNGGYFQPFEGGKLTVKPYVPQIGQPVWVDGVSMHNGRVDSDYASKDERVNAALCIAKNTVSISKLACKQDTLEAIGAGPLLLLDNERQTLASVDYYTKPQPRTAVGIDAQGQTLWLVVVDGRQTSYSEGISLAELTGLFTELGASAALNLDGGGSSTMVFAKDHVLSLANSPIHTGIPGRERPVANHLGIRINK